ncbi:MAG: hypothetical protein J7496_12085 [Novosphingobium sp.]|nr:hypothetical protein [Novosphingobium sp.]
MEAWVAYGLLSAFALFQALPLMLAFRGRTRGWLLTQCGFGIAMLALADVQYSGRGSFVLLAATAVMIAATSALSAVLAYFGFHLRASRSRIANSEVL